VISEEINHGLYSQHLIFVQLMDGPNKLECLSLTSLSSLAYLTLLYVMKKKKCCEYSNKCHI
jgi:hypothetical protein